MVFIVAAVLKLFGIDSFELYIYSFKIFGFGLTAVLSRMLIAAEILMGLGLMLKIRYKEVWSLTMLAFVGFTLFLVYVIIFRNDDNCHCFGDLVRLNPSESIIKNVVSMFLLLFVRREDDYSFKPCLKKWLIGISVAIAIILPFIVFPMDTVYNMIASKNNNINTIEFENSLRDPKTVNLLHFEMVNDSMYVSHDTVARLNLSDGRYIVSFVTAGCDFCKFGASKLSMIAEHNGIDKVHLKFLVWGYDADIVRFREETNTADSDYWFIHPKKSIDITYGRFPTYIWLNNGKIVTSGDLRNLNENGIVNFITTTN